MAKTILAICLIGLSSFAVQAHEVNRAFFKLSEQEGIVKVEAEFPWTLRNALIEYEPSLLQATTSDDFREVFKDYIQNTLIIYDQAGKQLEFLHFQEVKVQGHSHQNNFEIYFKGNQISRIGNWMMFNVYDNQINYHIINTEEGRFKFNTRTDQPLFQIQAAANKYSILSWAKLAFILPLVLVTSMFLAIRSEST